MTDKLKFPQNFYSYLEANPHIEIKGGRERESFLKIWMVQVEDRFFSRSWNKNPKSWFTEFQNTGIGQIKFGESIINVKGKKLSPDDPIQEKINQAYLNKFNGPEQIYYSRGITQPEYLDYTMELYIDQK